MARKFPEPQIIERDGTSQAGREQQALDPSYVSVDERSTVDLLNFAGEYAKSLTFCNEHNQPAGDWTGFLDHDLNGLAALVEDPTAVPGNGVQRLDTPHLALFLAFLRLLRHPLNLINSLTHRHLDYYYAQVLRMSRKAALPDHVHVLINPARSVDQARLPSGSMLFAGKDSSGRERRYRTDREVVVSRAKLVRHCSVFVDKEITGIREARERSQGTAEDSVLAMWKIALGDPRPGDALPTFDGRPFGYALLLDLQQFVCFAELKLFMDLSDLRTLVKLKQRLDTADGEWTEINSIIEKAGQQRLKDPTWKLNPVTPRDFFDNLKKALGAALDFERDGLPDVGNIDDLYAHIDEEDVQKFIKDKVFLDTSSFARMMSLKTRIDNEWREINRILERAGRIKRGKDSLFKIDPAESPDFDSNLKSALGSLDFSGLSGRISNLADYQAAIQKIEVYVRMNATQFGYVMKVVTKGKDATAGEWSDVYDLLAEAHKEKVYADRRRSLQQAQEKAVDRPTGFVAMLRVALGEEATEAKPPTLVDLRDLVQPPENYAFLEDVKSRLGGGSISSDEWARVYQVVELAQRVRERLPEPVALRERWLNLYAAEDARVVIRTSTGAADSTPVEWKTFGQQRPVDQSAPPPEVLGWAISSPMLQLAAGERTIILTLGFRSAEFNSERIKTVCSQKSFTLELSTEKGWKSVAPKEIKVGDYATMTKLSRTLRTPLAAIQFKLTLGEDVPPIKPPAHAVGGIVSHWPMLRLMLAQSWSDEHKQYVLWYEALRDLLLVAVHLENQVSGLIPASIQNDEAVLNSQKPFEPFGSSPVVGSRLYIGDPELVVKPLDSLTFHLNWRGGPSDLASHYTNYSDAAVGPWKTQISLVDDHRQLPLATAQLFEGTDTTKQHDIEISDLRSTLEKAKTYPPRTEFPPSREVSSWPRYIQWELSPTDFKHQIYPSVATKKALELAAAIAKSPATADASKYLVNPPYTPKLQSLRIDYVASTEIVLADASQAARPDRLFHVHPFGLGAIPLEGADGAQRFLPRYENEGELYLGFDNLKPPQTLSLLFQVAEGSADPDLERTPIAWDYLSGDDWRSLHDGSIHLDTTHGLANSGIVELAVHPDEPSTRLPSGLYWIRASIARNADSVCDIIAIHPHAVSATFVDHGNAPDHYERNLPEHAITKLLDRAPQIATVEQPFASDGGRPAESERNFYTRVSERLRHKQRALTTWDYERLVLEQFPAIYKAKCIPWNAALGTDPVGTVRMVVIPNVRDLSRANPFAPKVPAGLLAEIQEFLSDKCPPQAILHVCNAHYVPVKVRVGVRFLAGLDEGFYKKLLSDELSRFLSPWAYGEGSDIAIGGKIFANSIVNFLDERDYVDYVATIKLFSSEDDGFSFKLAQSDAAKGYYVSTERSEGVLVSAQQHDIDLISDAGYDTKNFSGINYMKIELDFVVGGST